MATYFLTGATGFLGGELARQLRAAGHRVRALVRDPARAAGLQAIGVELHRGDVTDAASLRGPMTGVAGVFHVAGWYKIGRGADPDAEAVNVQGTRHVLEAMRDLRVPAGVYTSTLAVNSDTHGRVVDETYRFGGRHLSLYDRTKAEAHRVAESFAAAGLPLVIVQPGVIYGPGDTSGIGATWRQFLQRKLPLVPSRTAFCWAHVEDVARGHLLAMERGAPGRNYFLAGPVHTLAEALAMAERITGVRGPRPHASPAVLRAAALAMTLVDRVVDMPPEMTSEGLRVVAGTTYLGSGARAARELGWRARPLADGLVETLRYEMARMQPQP